MFKRTVEMRLVKTPKVTTTPAAASERKTLDADAIVKIVERQTARIAVGCVAVYAAVTVLNTASQIAINATPKKH